MIVAVVPPAADDYRPIVEYTSADGQRLRLAAADTADDHSHFQVGHTIGVLYAPDNPADARLDTWQGRWATDAVTPGLGTLSLVLGLFSLRRNPAAGSPARRRRP